VNPVAGASDRANRSATAESARSVQIDVRAVRMNVPARRASDTGRGMTDGSRGVCAPAIDAAASSPATKHDRMTPSYVGRPVVARARSSRHVWIDSTRCRTVAQDRRSFLATLGATLFATAGHKTWHAFDALQPAATTTLDRIGIQLWTVRKLAAKDLEGTLGQLAMLGYKEVELEAFYNRTPADWRDILRKNSLVAPSSHVTVEAIETRLDKTFADAHIVGVEWLTMRSLPRGQHTTADDWKHVAERFNAAAARAKEAGFRFAFHNHNDIVRETPALSPIDILMKETDPALVNFEMDIYWAVSGGADPLALLARYPGRFTMLHVKDGKPPYTDASQTDVGQGTIDFKPIFAKARGIEHYFVESDSAADPMAFAASAYKYLSTLNF
jgi:sugar phosphate isomerase/epimerase